MSDPKAAPAVVYPECVEHGVWVPIPRARPAGPLVLRLKDVDPDESKAIKDRGAMAFHLAGCTGDFANHVPETAVAQAMSLQMHDPTRYGGYPSTTPASFFFHLGDIVYKDDDKSDLQRADQQRLYNEHFYLPYAGYPKNIFALAGNHDGKDSKREEKSAIKHFLKNFCDSTRSISPDNLTSNRATMVQPYPYWVLQTPLAYFIALYGNDINGGQLDDPEGREHPQYDWLVQTLTTIHQENDGRAVFIAVHYPPYSAATDFVHRGDPNLGPTPRPRPLQPLAMILQQAFHESQQYPDAVFSAHAHHYQRITYTRANGRQIPFIIVGCGGHGPIEGLTHDCEDKQRVGPPPALPADIVYPRGLVLPDGDSAKLVAYNDRDFGFARMTIDREHKIMHGEFFSAFNAGNNAGKVPALSDSFTLDLASHHIIEHR